jgi:hypothetical protein
MDIRGKLFCLSCIGSETPNLIPHFIRYYRSIGVDEFLIILHSNSSSSPNFRYANDILLQHDITPLVYWIDRFLGIEKLKRLRQLVDKYIASDAWYINADLDEFVEYAWLSHNPGAFRKLLKYCELSNYTFVRGRLVDMVSSDGSLIQIKSNVALGEQFPRQCRISERILRATCRKIIACRGYHRCTPGHHYVLNTPKFPFPGLLRVNHFKWDATVTYRLKERHRNYVEACYKHADESRRFLEYIQRHGKIDVSEMGLDSNVPPDYEWRNGIL